MQRARASYTFGRFHLDVAERRLSREGQPISLTPKAFDTLVTLVRHAGHALSKDELMRAVWPDGFVEEVNLAYNISVLRKALADGWPGGAYIETVPKLGYRFVAPVQVVEAASPTQPRRSNLPAQLTRFIGRELELEEVSTDVADRRLVTLTGAAGMGKTRLAIEVGAAVDSSFGDGVWLVELAPLSDGALIPGAVANVLGIVEQPDRAMTDVIAGVIGERHLLLILDNCEHLIDASAHLAEALLRVCPRLHILATSREVLRLPGEVVRHVPPLGAPDLDDAMAIDRALEFDAVRLFAELSAAAQPGFSVTANNRAAVAHLCQRLDGMPLAIEMAAAQVAFLGLSGVLAGLNDRLNLLEGDRRAAAPHQHTLRATLDWSYDLLSEPERALLARLSVFAGGWTAEAAQIVCESTHQDLLQLARKSLVVIVPGEGDEHPRFRLLETVRDYAAEKLRERGEREAIFERHLSNFLAMLDEPIELAGPRVDLWVRRVDADFANVRAAFAWAMERDDSGEDAMRMADDMGLYAYHRGNFAELSVWAEQAWKRGERASSQARARGIMARASASIFQGAKAQGLRYCREALPLLREAGDRVRIASCLEVLANNAFDESVGTYAEEALRLYRELGSRDGEARALRALGFAALCAGDRVRAADMLEQAIATAPWDVAEAYNLFYSADPVRALRLGANERARLGSSSQPGYSASLLQIYGVLLLLEGQHELALRVTEESIWIWQLLRYQQPITRDVLKQPLPLDLNLLGVHRFGQHAYSLGFAFLSLGYVEYLISNSGRALVRLRQSLEVSRQIEMTWHQAMASFMLASLHIDDEAYRDASRTLLECLRQFRDLHQEVDMMCALVQIANVLSRREDASDVRLATRLLGTINGADHPAGHLTYYFNRLLVHWFSQSGETIIKPTLAAARAVLGDAEFEAAYAEGQRLTLDEAVALALAEE